MNGVQSVFVELLLLFVEAIGSRSDCSTEELHCDSFQIVHHTIRPALARLIIATGRHIAK